MTSSNGAARSKAGDDEDDEGYPPLPLRPFTSYNIFSQLERRYIVQTNSNVVADLPAHIDQNASARPEKYRNIILPKDWYVVGANRKKRQHHVNHGVISFVDLSKTISRNWGTCDDATRRYCERLAEGEMVRYSQDINAYSEKYGEEALKARRKKRKKKGKKKIKASKVAARSRNDDDAEEEEDSIPSETVRKDKNLLQHHQAKKYAQPFPDCDFMDQEDFKESATTTSASTSAAASSESSERMLVSRGYQKNDLSEAEAELPPTRLRSYDHSLAGAVASRRSSLDSKGSDILTGVEAAKAFDDMLEYD
jgi:hypothetical protein